MLCPSSRTSSLMNFGRSLFADRIRRLYSAQDMRSSSSEKLERVTVRISCFLLADLWAIGPGSLRFISWIALDLVQNSPEMVQATLVLVLSCYRTRPSHSTLCFRERWLSNFKLAIILAIEVLTLHQSLKSAHLGTFVEFLHQRWRRFRLHSEKRKSEAGREVKAAESPAPLPHLTNSRLNLLCHFFNFHVSNKTEYSFCCIMSH